MIQETPLKLVAVAAVLSAGLTACADEDEVAIADDPDIEVVSDTGTLVASPPVDLDAADFDALDEDMDLYGGAEVTTEQATASDKLIKVRAEPLDEQQKAARDKIDIRQKAKDVKAEVDALCKDKKKLADPAMTGNESFAAVDRDGNNALSPAEFAIYDLANINPLVKCSKDDGTRPFVSTKALNMSADDFVRFDTNGDMAISRDEFSGMTG